MSDMTGGRGTGGYVMTDMGGTPAIGGQSSGGRSTGGYIMSDMTGGRGTGGYVMTDMGGTPTVGGQATIASASNETVRAVDPPPSPVGVVEHWQDTRPQYLTRSDDLPLFDPPQVSLASRATGNAVEVTVCGGYPSMTLRWESEGKVQGAGRDVVWYPASPDDALRLAARGPGGVVFTLLRARDLPGLSIG
jgi:hypothetical protein